MGKNKLISREFRWDFLLLFWILVIIYVVAWPWSDYRGHSHWEHVVWIPFQDFSFSVESLLNVIGNILLFLPFGYFTMRSQSRICPSKNWAGVIASLFFSIGIEWYQVFCHSHFPSATDLCSNVFGGWVGVAFGRSGWEPHRWIQFAKGL